MTTQTPILQDLQQLAVNAHNWTSFSPEKRGAQIVSDYSNELTKDIEILKAEGIDEAQINDYIERYKRNLSSWLHAKSNCTSTMITGGANYNVRRAEKANRSESRHYEIFRVWREKAKKSILRKAKEPITFISEVERYRNELANAKRNHELMKEGNKTISKAKKEGTDLTEYLTNTFNIAPHMIEWTMKFGFGLANNSANMRRLEDRIKLMESKEAMSNTVGAKEYTFEGGKVLMNYEADRIQIKHDVKPNFEGLQLMKKNGFKWSPFNQAWQRQITQNAIYVTNHILNISIGN